MVRVKVSFRLTLSSPGVGGGHFPSSGFLCITRKRFHVRGRNFTTFPKILWGIFWSVFRKHLLNPVAMVTLSGSYGKPEVTNSGSVISCASCVTSHSMR